MSRYTKIIYTAILGVLFLGFLLSLNFESKQIFPVSSDSDVVYNIAHEEVAENWSQATANIEKDSSITLKYTLSNKLQEPFTGIFFHKDSKEGYFDFSSLDVITLKLKSSKARRIPIYLTIDYQKNNDPKNKFPSLPVVHVIDYKGEGYYSIHKDEFEIPSWWLRYQGMKREDLGKLNFSKVNYILINSCQVLGPGISDEINIQNITLSKSNLLNYWVFGGLSFLLVGTFLFHYGLKRKKILIPYKTKEFDYPKKEDKTSTIIQYIGQNFSNPELAVEDLEKELGISGREIGAIIKREFNTSFKAYLNVIRLAEVKRMLKETDLSISEIAYQSGYNNISHFNRVFKKEINLSPKEFREKITQSSQEKQK